MEENEKKYSDYEVLAEVGRKTKNKEITVDQIDKFFKKNKIKPVKNLYSEDDKKRAVDHFILLTELERSNKNLTKVLTDKIDDLQKENSSLKEIVDGINDVKTVIKKVNAYIDAGNQMEQLQTEKAKLEKEINALKNQRDAISRSIANSRQARPTNSTVELRSQHQQINPTIQQQ